MTTNDNSHPEDPERFSPKQPRDDIRDVRFDLTLTIKADKLDPVIKALASELPSRKRQRTADQEKKHRRQVGAILANGLQGQAAKRPIFYPRNQAAYRGDTPSWYSGHTVPPLMNGLARAGYIENTIAESGTFHLEKKQSTFSMTSYGHQVISEMGLSPSDIEIVQQDHRFIILRDMHGMSIKLDRCNAGIAMKIRNSEEINAFISQFEISYISNDGILMAPCNIQSARIYNVHFGQGGRFYRCFWHTLSAEERKTMWIENSKTVELDYGSLFACMGYNELGVAAPLDPYDIPFLRNEADKQGRDYAKVRTPVKKLLQTGINAPKPIPFYNWKFGGLDNVNIEQANKAIWDTNEPIKHLANSGAGLRMMVDESDIAERIMLEGARRGIPVLSVHDSFIVREQDEDWLREIMIRVYHDKFHYDPRIKKSS